VILAKVLAQKAEYAKALEMARSAVELSGDDPVALYALAHILALAKQSREASEILDDLQRSRKRRYISAGNIATIYIGLDKKELAFDWLEKAYQDKDIVVVWLKVSPVLDPLRSDPRFMKLLKRISHAE